MWGGRRGRGTCSGKPIIAGSSTVRVGMRRIRLDLWGLNS